MENQIANYIDVAPYVIKAVYEAFKYFDSKISGSDVVSGLFDWQGNLIEGSKVIHVEKHTTAGGPENIWWYRVTPVNDYVFVRFPVHSNLIELMTVSFVSGYGSGSNPDGKNDSNFGADANIWRWVSNVEPGRIYGGTAENVRTQFFVFGYKPKALLKEFKGN
jgi:hypothetical protein